MGLKTPKPFARIDVSGFAAVLVALLAAFLLPAWDGLDTPRTAVPVDLAKVSHAAAMRDALREDALFIAVRRNGDVWFNGDRFDPNYLPLAIRERLKQGAQPRVYIRADRRARYGAILEVLDKVRSAGIENITFVVQEGKSQPPL